MPEYEWDAKKARINIRKHDVGFEEAISVFEDKFSLTRDDPLHSEIEERYIDIGLSKSGNLLVVVYTERGDRIRLISCRKATPAEKLAYEKQKS